MKQFRSGNYQDQGYHKSFQPSMISRNWILDDMNIIQLLSRADRELGRLDMYSEYIPNIDLYIRLHVAKEATLSSKIEGTQTKMEDALLDEANVPLDKRDDWEEVQNYILAMEWSIKELKKLPFSSRLICEAHERLMQGVRGERKYPGSFRESQNWIGGSSINNATFVPPNFTSLNELMSDLDNFINNENIILPDLIKIALYHYQFETIHPFLDGNGRIGRLLIPLYLINRGILKKPVLYLSDFFEKNRALYYDNLTLVRENNDLSRWLRFFLEGIIETSKKGINTFDNILKLKKNTEAIIQDMGTRTGRAQKVINSLYEHPYVKAEDVSNITNLSLPASYTLITELEKLDILFEISGGKRNRLYVFKNYLQLFLE
ncbi:MAG: Fic family protein [Candidatus Marinimicrobia bacterium]|nr:Fic family protein [Candidatus Neomarinimicrobiota bacterium]